MTFSENQKYFYKEERYAQILSKGLLGNVQNSVHKILDRALSKSRYNDILEVGAGNFEHFKRTQLKFNKYLATDIRYSEGSPLDRIGREYKKTFPGFDFKFADAEKLEFDAAFDLLIASCLIIHLRNPDRALSSWRRAVKSGGELVIYVPCEPGILLRIGRFLFIRRKHKRAGILDSNLLYAQEHVTSFFVINELIKNAFRNDSIKITTWPLRHFPLWNMNLAFVYHIRKA